MATNREASLNHTGYIGPVSTVYHDSDPVAPIDEVRNALRAASDLAYQIAALTDTLCGTLPESTVGPSAPRSGSIIHDLAYDAGETSRAIAKANSDINRLMRAFGI
ncbi:hypothetical protein D3C87_626340 [compost metagenome]